MESWLTKWTPALIGRELQEKSVNWILQQQQQQNDDNDNKKNNNNNNNNNNKGKAVPLQAWSGPEGSRKLRFPDFMTTAQDGGKVVILTHRPPLPPSKYTRYSFLLGAESTPEP